MKLYLAVTHDKYELPLYVADTPMEMAEWMGTTYANVLSCCSRNENSGIAKSNRPGEIRLRRVIIEEDDDDR